MKTNLFKNTFMSVAGVITFLLVLTFISEGEISAENKLPIIQKQTSKEKEGQKINSPGKKAKDAGKYR